MFSCFRGQVAKLLRSIETLMTIGGLGWRRMTDLVRGYRRLFESLGRIAVMVIESKGHRSGDDYRGEVFVG
jgi:hypothetical protein